MGLAHLEISAVQSLRLLIRAIASAAASCTDTCRCFRPTSTIFFHLGAVEFSAGLSSLEVMDVVTKRQAAATMSSFRVFVRDLSETWARSLQTWIRTKIINGSNAWSSLIYVMQALFQLRWVLDRVFECNRYFRQKRKAAMHIRRVHGVQERNLNLR
jgi:hypothetical protein